MWSSINHQVLKPWIQYLALAAKEQQFHETIFGLIERAVAYHNSSHKNTPLQQILKPFPEVSSPFSRYIWGRYSFLIKIRILNSVATTTGPRIVFCKLQQKNLTEKFKDFRNSIRWNYYLNVIEILRLLTLSLVPSSEIFLIHAFAFSMFILTSLMSMIIVTFYIKVNMDEQYVLLI